MGIQYYSSISKINIAKVSARSALKLGVAIEGVFLDYSLCHDSCNKCSSGNIKMERT